MRDVFRSWGHEADVFALEMDPDLEGDGRSFSSFKAGSGKDILILHFALPSALTAAFLAHRGPRVLIHHNITPPEFFLGFDPEMARICEIGREEVRSLHNHTDLALGDSEFNRLELEEAGFPRTGVLPILLDFERYRLPGNPVLERELSDGPKNVLFVGRISPNKRQEDLIKLAAYWRKFISPDVKLLLVGKIPRRRSYFDALQSLSYELGFTPFDVVFTGHVAHDDLLSYYKTADLFVSMSAHEGFGVPLVEAMLMDVPILARGEGAVPGTLGGAGVVFRTEELAEVAELAHALATEAPLRKKVLAGQRRRLEAFQPDRVGATLKTYLETL